MTPALCILLGCSSCLRVLPPPDDALSQDLEEETAAMAESRAASMHTNVQAHAEEEEVAVVAAAGEIETEVDVDLDRTKSKFNNQGHTSQVSLKPNRDRSPQPISPRCVWPSPVRKTGSCGFDLPAMSGFKVSSRFSRVCELYTISHEL
ncbi:unnamed protein product [Dibothriocephalus latus]|uniref:CTNNB1 binding N-teminal domain-containing protein n=1 Tax=Dibothriocephalus latus TaxID=60516 RepID=A0A3P7M1X5_DIBLA|nr:unnamed protein product [Dibothriocephalus latus]